MCIYIYTHVYTDLCVYIYVYTHICVCIKLYDNMPFGEFGTMILAIKVSLWYWIPGDGQYWVQGESTQIWQIRKISCHISHQSLGKGSQGSPIRPIRGY